MVSDMSDAEGIDVRGVKGVEPKTPKASIVGNGEEVSPSPTYYGVWGSVVTSTSGVRAEPWPKTISVLSKCHRMYLVERSVEN